MKHFLAIHTGTPDALKKSGWNELSETRRQERQQAGMRAWGAYSA